MYGGFVWFWWCWMRWNINDTYNTVYSKKIVRLIHIFLFVIKNMYICCFFSTTTAYSTFLLIFSFDFFCMCYRHQKRQVKSSDCESSHESSRVRRFFNVKKCTQACLPQSHKKHIYKLWYIIQCIIFFTIIAVCSKNDNDDYDYNFNNQVKSNHQLYFFPPLLHHHNHFSCIFQIKI